MDYIWRGFWGKGWMPCLMMSILAGLCRLTSAAPSNTAPQYALTTRFTYKATVAAVTGDTKGVRLWLPVPSNSEWQTVEDLKVDAPVPYKVNTEKKYGNRMVYLAFSRPRAPLDVTVQFTVKRKHIEVLGLAQNPLQPPLPGSQGKEWGRWLKPDAKVPVGGKYAAMAAQLTAGQATPEAKLHAIFDHVVATMQYDYKKDSPHYGEGDVAFVCDYKKGNCSDLHSYMISMARSAGVPALLEYGFPITGVPLTDPLPEEGKIGGYHCWVWFQDGTRGWVPVDASDARKWLDSGKAEKKDYLFGNLIPERSAVAISRGRDLTLVPAQKAGPLNYFIYPYAEADGKPTKADWVLTYQLLDH